MIARPSNRSPPSRLWSCCGGPFSQATRQPTALPQQELPVPLERVAQGQGHFVLDTLQLAIDGNVLLIRLRSFAGVQFHELVSDVADGGLFTLDRKSVV